MTWVTEWAWALSPMNCRTVSQQKAGGHVSRMPNEACRGFSNSAVTMGLAFGRSEVALLIPKPGQVSLAFPIMAVVEKELTWRKDFLSLCFSWFDPFWKIWVNFILSSLSFIVPVGWAGTRDSADVLVCLWDVDLDTKVLRKTRICWPGMRDGWETKEKWAQAEAQGCSQNEDGLWQRFSMRANRSGEKSVTFLYKPGEYNQ